MSIDAVMMLYDALLRPRRLIATFEAGGWRVIGWAALATLLGIVAALAVITVVLRGMLPVDTPRLLLNIALAPLFAYGGSSLGLIGNTSNASPRTLVAFWMIRCQIVITPLLAIVVGLGASTDRSSRQNLWLGLILLTLFGIWFGGGLSVAFELRSKRTETASIRWILACGALVISSAIWLSPPLSGTDWALYVPFCVGLAIGLVRPLSYVWQVVASLVLVGLARRGREPAKLLARHPIVYDDLCLLPLPGLRELLLCACAADRQQGSAWLLRVAEHAGQRRTAGRAVHRAAADPQLAHSLLFWLSKDVHGARLLRELVETSDAPHPLIAAYAAFAYVTTPQRWVEALARHQKAFAAAASYSGEPALMALLATSADVLCAERWTTAAQSINAASLPSTITNGDDVWRAVNATRSWMTRHTPATTRDHDAALRALLAELEPIDGWPLALLVAAGEQWLFLIGVEQARHSQVVLEHRG